MGEREAGRSGAAAEAGVVPPAPALPSSPRPRRGEVGWPGLALRGAAVAFALVAFWRSWQPSPTLAPAPPRVALVPAPSALAGFLGAPAGDAAVADPLLRDALVRLRAGLERTDRAGLLALADPAGVEVAPFSGGLPDAGLPVGDPRRLLERATGGAPVQAIAWRQQGADGVIVLTHGWPGGTLPLEGGRVLEMSPLAAVGLVPRDGGWYWRWLMTDPVGALDRHARTAAWYPLPR